MSFIEELKRRNVFKVGIAYLFGAWILVQVSDIILETFKAPEWTMQFIVVLLSIGFFVALFFAWAFEMTPEGIKRENEVDRSQSITPQTGKKLNNTILVLMAVAIAYLLFDKFSGTSEMGSEPFSPETAQQADEQTNGERDPSPVEPAASRQSIAVLPFTNRSNREEDVFFTDGIHDDLLTTIARIGSMKVISRTSVMEYKGTTKKIPEIARELGVANILEGGIQRSGNQVRINVQLIDAQTDEHLWAEIFDRELTAENLFAIQSEISTKIAQALQTALSPEETRRINTMPTQNLDAYDAHLRGRQLMATRRVEDLETSTHEFLKAVELDPNFALAWVGVADSHALFYSYSDRDINASLELRRDAINKALALDPALGEAYTSLGSWFLDKYRSSSSEADKAEASAAFQKAIELSPNYATAYQWYSGLLRQDPLRSRESLELALKAVELDPRSGIIQTNLVFEYLKQGLFSRAEQQAQKLIEMNPGFPNGYHQMVDHHLWNTGQFAKALANAEKLLEIDTNNTDARRHQIEVYVEVGDFAKARAIQEEITSREPNDFWATHADLLIAAQTGNAPAAREALQWQLSFIESQPWVSGLARTFLIEIGDAKRALELTLQSKPDWLEPAAWETLVREDDTGGCLTAWLMIHEGDEELGRQLLARALLFQEQELPAAIEHADRYGPDICFMAQGEHEKALNALETSISHGHIYTWARWSRAPIYDPIRIDPRFLVLNEEVARRTAAQRELIEAGGVEAGP